MTKEAQPADKDAVTGLPNRRRFVAAYQDHAALHLVIVTLSGANEFNRLLRTIGHDHADEFLRLAAQRLRRQLGETYTLYHVALLSFVFIAEAPVPPLLLTAINAAFDEPIACAGLPIMTDIAIGIAPCEGPDPGVVLRAALAATQDCRASGAPFAYYDRRSDQAHQRGFMLLSALGQALTAPGQLRLNFQPKYALADGRLTSAEVLLRWHHPVFGAIAPVEFIPLSESTSHIHALTDWVLDEALRHAAAWRDAGTPIRLAINVSPRNLARPGFARRMAERLRAHRLNGPMIELEFTEGLLMASDQTVLGEVEQLRAAGVAIALDDFGTGFSNLSYMTHLPADIIKIDKSFILRIGTDARAATMVKAIVELAHELGYRVVAEGIETDEIYDMLRRWQCDEGQGFLMSRPLEAGAFAALLGAQSRRSIRNPGERRTALGVAP
jgi:EAL domain-containing protein (putative c-di-GMP-specific phosphodiesterase class I)/GGDEF domain-containing protein